MSLLKKAKRAVKHYLTMKAARKKLGLTGKAKFLRQFRRGLRGGLSGSAVLGGSVPTSASNFQSRSISQLMGGV